MNLKLWPENVQLYRIWWYWIQCLFYAICPPVPIIAVVTFILVNHAWTCNVAKICDKCLKLLDAFDEGISHPENGSISDPRMGALQSLSALVDDGASFRKSGYVKMASGFSGALLLGVVVAFILTNGLVVFDLVTGEKNSNFIHDGIQNFVLYLFMNYTWIWMGLNMIYASSKPSGTWENFVDELSKPLNVGRLSRSTSTGTDVVAMISALHRRVTDFTWVFFGIHMTKRLYSRVATALYTLIFTLATFSMESLDVSPQGNSDINSGGDGFSNSSLK